MTFADLLRARLPLAVKSVGCCTALARLEMRWRNKVIGIAQSDDGVTLSVDTPDGPYSLHAEYVVACDGSRSSIRRHMGCLLYTSDAADE